MNDEEQKTNENDEKLQQDRDILQDELAELENAIENVKSQLLKVNSLIHNASSVEESIKNLLDLKQKHGSLMAVRDTQSLANDADLRARQGERQSQLLLIFTIITVFFVNPCVIRVRFHGHSNQGIPAQRRRGSFLGLGAGVSGKPYCRDFHVALCITMDSF
ncbi:hypothetical protein H9Q73_004152 [Fusarium xylarioides]|nr:hypothetical protein H9Q73_004152 [Fusarium xylarioides]